MDMSATSLQYVYLNITFGVGGLTFNPTSLAVKMAFKPVGIDPVSPADECSASWITDNTGPTPVYYCRCNTGPGGDATPGIGVWQPWAKVVSSPEIPWIKGDGLVVIT